MRHSKAKLVTSHLPCPLCDSSDAYSTYDDGHGYCFSCEGYVKKHLTSDENHGILVRYNRDIYSNLIETLSESSAATNNRCYIDMTEVVDHSNNNYTLQQLATEGISIATHKKFGVYLRVDPSGIPREILYPYDGTDTAKIRKLDRKEFYSVGEMSKPRLFGMDKFPKGSAKAITITEGEKDAEAVYEMMGPYPVVSVRSASSASVDCEANLDYLNSFETIYLCLDNDEPGKKATAKILRLFNINKVRVVEMGGGLKDAFDYLKAGRQEEFRKCWWNAKAPRPKNIVSDSKSIHSLIRDTGKEAIASYPFASLNERTYGIRSSELVLFTAKEKIGKTESFRAIEHHLLMTTDFNIGIIHLEESERRAVQGLLTYEMRTPVHLPDCMVSKEEQVKAFDRMVKREGRVSLYSHFGTDDPDVILDAIRYMVTVEKCKFIFLDHITMLVSGREEDDERRTLDYISTRLAMMTRDLDFTLFLISHVNDNGQTRGSRYISKIADLIIHLDRDLEATNDIERNTTTVMIKGNRFSGKTGPCAPLLFDTTTYTMSEMDGTPAAF